MPREPRPAVSGAAVPVAVAKMSGKGSPGRGAYGSLADGEDVDVEGNGELAWYHQPVRRQNPCFLLFSFAFFASLATLGVGLNAAGVVNFGPRFAKEKPIHGLSICEMDFCGGGVLVSEEGVIVDNSERAGWMNPLDADKLAACSKQRDVQASMFEVVLIVQFDNPTGSPVELSNFAMTFATDDEDVLAECVPVTSPALINPLGGNRLDVDCKFHTKVVAGMVSSWWNGDTFTLNHWWTGTASVGANANLKALSFSHGEVGDDPVKFSLPPRPYGGPAVSVWPDAVASGAQGASTAEAVAAIGAYVTASLGSKTAMIGDDTAAVMIADEKRNAFDPANADETTPTPFGLPVGTKLSDLFDAGSNDLFPLADDLNGVKCPGNMDLSLSAPSAYICALYAASDWAEAFAACAANDGDGGLFTTWNSDVCRELMKGVNFFVRVVITNPSDVVMTLTQFKPRVWLGGREGSVAEAPVNSETTVEARAAASLDFYVTVPWESEESFIVDARRWWEGGSLDVRLDASFGARAMGVAVRVDVPELAYDAQTLGEVAKTETEAKTATRANNGECACLVGACQFGAAVPGAGKGVGETCVLGAQCASNLCGWDFKCADTRR